MFNSQSPSRTHCVFTCLGPPPQDDQKIRSVGLLADFAISRLGGEVIFSGHFRARADLPKRNSSEIGVWLESTRPNYIRVEFAPKPPKAGQ